MRALALLLAASALVAALPLAQTTAPAQFDHVVCPFATPEPTRPLERCNVRATAQTGPASEIAVAMDPRDPAHQVVVAKGYNATRVVDTFTNGGVVTPYAATFDGGASWAEGYLQAFHPDVQLPLGWGVGNSDEQGSDPVVTFAKDGSVLAVTLNMTGYPQNNGLALYRSLDGGRTFAKDGMARHDNTDKQWIATDAASGRMFMIALGPGGTGVQESNDDGKTWNAVRPVCPGSPGGVTVAGAGVAVVVCYTGAQLLSVRSLDGGATWSAPVQVAKATSGQWGLLSGGLGNYRTFRTPVIPQVAAAPAGPDVYTAWFDRPAGKGYDCNVTGCSWFPDADVFVSASHDAGATWGPPVRVNDDPTSVMFQFLAAVAVSPRGDVHVAWLDQRFDPTGLTYVAYYAHSSDGGAHFGPNVLLSDAPSPVVLGFHQVLDQSHLNFVGDYIGIAASDERAVVAFPDERYGRIDAFTATVR